MPKEHVIRIDPSKPLIEQPGTGHNRWHEAIEPVVEVDPGDTVVFKTRDAFDGQLDRRSANADVGKMNLNLDIRKGDAERRGIQDLQCYRDDYFAAPEIAVPRRFFATTGISVRKDGTNESEDLTLAARNALLNMIEHLETRGFTPQQGYALCSVAVDLHISQTVGVPNLLVTALLPLDIFV